VALGGWLEERLHVEEERHHRLEERLRHREDPRLHLHLLRPEELLHPEGWNLPWEILLAMTLEIRMN